MIFPLTLKLVQMTLTVLCVPVHEVTIASERKNRTLQHAQEDSIQRRRELLGPSSVRVVRQVITVSQEQLHRRSVHQVLNGLLCFFYDSSSFTFVSIINCII